MDTDVAKNTDSSIETVTSNPFDGKVTDHSMAWSHVTAAYGISLGVLCAYVAVVNFRLKAIRNQRGTDA
jgi:hypothetical protein